MLWSKQWATLPAMALRLRIREWRVRRGLSLRQLAARSGVQLSNLSRAERGQIDLRVSTLLLLAKALRVDPGLLLPKRRQGAARGRQKGKR